MRALKQALASAQRFEVPGGDVSATASLLVCSTWYDLSCMHIIIITIITPHKVHITKRQIAECGANFMGLQAALPRCGGTRRRRTYSEFWATPPASEAMASCFAGGGDHGGGATLPSPNFRAMRPTCIWARPSCRWQFHADARK